MVYAWPLATMTGPFTCGFGRYGIVAPFGGDWNKLKIYEFIECSFMAVINNSNITILVEFVHKA